MKASTSFALDVGPLRPVHVQVHSWSGTEAMSRPYDLRVRVSTRLPAPIFERAVFGATATLHCRSGGHHANFHGMVAAVRAEGQRHTADRDRLHYTLRIVPHLWLLGRRKNSQIFQNQRIGEVIASVLSARGVPFELRLADPGPQRAYCTQYEETDLGFIRRLCAENGYFFWFVQGPPALDDVIALALDEGLEHLRRLTNLAPPGLPGGPPQERLVITDQCAYDPIDGGAVRFSPQGVQAKGDDFVFGFTTARAIRSTHTVYREYDWRRPPLQIEAAADARDALRQDLEVYEHEGTDPFPEWSQRSGEAARMLKRRRRHERTARGASNSVRLSPGGRFTLLGEDGPSGEYAVVAVHHEGVEHPAEGKADAYTNRFECVPADVEYVPARLRRRRVQACLTATVCGPAGEEIHVNEHGQIKVKFHWDRSPEAFEPTCWLRSMQPWAGAQWGFQFIPRVGMEVVVGFEGGDPDKPLVLGTVYNGITPVPFELPRSKTRSGVRTRSTPRSDGFNELSFEDSAGGEQIFVHAQRDYVRQINNDRSGNVGRDDALAVGREQRIRVAEMRRLDVGGDHETTVHGALRDRVDGPSFIVRSGVEARIRGDHNAVFEQSETSQVEGDVRRLVRGDTVTDLRGNLAVLVGRDGAERSATMLVEGTAEAKVTRAVEVSSETEIVLRVGTSFVRIAEDAIEIGADSVRVSGRDAQVRLEDGNAHTMVNNSYQVLSNDSIVLKAVTASLKLAAEAHLDGANILLNSPASAKDEIEVAERSVTTVELVDQDGNPVANQRFRIKLDGGGEYMGFLDENGKAEVTCEGAGEIDFPDLANPEPA